MGNEGISSAGARRAGAPRPYGGGRAVRLVRPAELVGLRKATPAEWRAAHGADGHATFLHGPDWSELWEEYSDGAVHPAPLRAELGDGSSAVLGITRVPTRVPGVLRDTLSPEGNCGGWVSASSLSPDQTQTLAEVVLSLPAHLWRLGPADAPFHVDPPPGGRKEWTHVIDLREGPAAARAAWRSEARRLAARAARSGARVTEAARATQWRAFARLYRATSRTWDNPLTVYRDELFPLLAARCGAGVRLWTVELDGEPCAGAVVLVHRTHATGWLAATARGRCPGAANLLQSEIVEALAAEGVETYDLNGSGPFPGVVRFKESLGARRRRVLAFERRHPLELVGSAAKRLLPVPW